MWSRAFFPSLLYRENGRAKRLRPTSLVRADIIFSPWSSLLMEQIWHGIQCARIFPSLSLSRRLWALISNDLSPIWILMEAVRKRGGERRGRKTIFLASGLKFLSLVPYTAGSLAVYLPASFLVHSLSYWHNLARRACSRLNGPVELVVVTFLQKSFRIHWNGKVQALYNPHPDSVAQTKTDRHDKKERYFSLLSVRKEGHFAIGKSKRMSQIRDL